MSAQAGTDARARGSSGRRSSLGRRIGTAVAVSALVIIALAGWVLLVPYEVSGSSGDPLRCDAMIHWVHDAEGQRQKAAFEESCDESRSSRRTIALIAGAAVATVAAAASTWPSRRLTGEALGPES